MSAAAELQSPLAAEVVIDGRPYVNFGGSSYLGLSRHPEVLEAGVAALRTYGAGMPPYRGQDLVSPPHAEAERAAINFFRTETAALLSSGYLFGFAATEALAGRCSHVFVDELAHDSLQQAVAALPLPSQRYRHADAAHLQELLDAAPGGVRPMIVTDGAFPGRGVLAPLETLSQLARARDGWLVVDDSHAFGVVGPTGRATQEILEPWRDRMLAGGSLAKGFGTCGGVVPATAGLQSVLRGTRVMRGASPGPASSAAMCAAALKVFQRHPEILERVRANTARAKAAARALGLEVADGGFPVVAFALESEDRTHGVREALWARGLNVYVTRYGAPHAPSFIRCGIFADHSFEHIDCLFAALRELV